jgi:hypothetical protein
MVQIHQLFNESKKAKFAYKWDRKEYFLTNNMSNIVEIKNTVYNSQEN